MSQLAFQFDTSEFRKHHADNPEIYEYFKRFAFEKINAGARKLGAKSVWERIRWETANAIDKKGREYRLNNNFTAAYARKFMRDFPQHEGIFETRTAAIDAEGVG